jgi:NitT/TauT family transport system substrate-binding protein
MNRRSFLSLTSLAVAGLPACGRKPQATNAPVRFGHFPNITHIQALVAHQLSRRGRGWYEERLGVPIEWYTYNAGPSATEAIFAGSLDVTYIGPSPVLNAYTKSKGAEIRVLAGAANGGSSILLRPEAGIKTLDDFRGKKIATPQLGNTQDVQLRALLTEHGFKMTQTGGDVSILPTPNADLLQSFQGGLIDGAWAPEPFASILELQAKAQNFLEDRDTNVTMLVSSVAFLKDRPLLASKLAMAHIELTAWVLKNPAEARELIVAELTQLTTKAPNPAVVDKALSRVVITNELSRPSLQKMLDNAQKAGFLKDPPPLDQLLSSLVAS